MRTPFHDLPRPRAAGALVVGFLLATLFLLAALGFAPANASPRKDTRAERTRSLDFDWSQRLRPGQVLEVRGVNGAIDARAAKGSEARVTAVKTSKRCDPDEVKIEVSETEHGILVCAIYPGQHGRGACGDSKDGDGDDDSKDGNWGGHRNCDVNVHFTVEVPDGVELKARTVNGGIDVDEVGGEVDAQTVNGSVHVATTDVAHAQTVNGSIEVEMGRARWDGDLEFQTVNGSITLRAPSRLSGRIEAETMNGRIESDFSMTTSGSFGRRHITGTIGEGGRGRLKMETLNGSIHLLQVE